MKNKKVSVIVPVYNMEKYLSRCVDSILAQTYKNLEVILVDDGSKDSSPAICDQYSERDSRVKVVHKENGGLSSARNAGLDVATGDYIGFVDSDDYISPEMYSVLCQCLENSDCEIANLMYVRADENGRTTPSKVPHNTDKEIEAEQFAKELMLHTGDVSVCTKLFCAGLFQNIRFPEGKLNEQNLIWAKELGYKTVMWSFAYADWDNNKQPSEEYAMKKILDNLHNGEVILLHPTSKTNASIMSKMIKELKREGFRFGTAKELCEK